MKSNLMEYKNYYGSVHYSDDDRILYGKLEGIRDLVSFEGRDVGSLRKSFEEAVDDYLETCKEQGRAPEQPFKGSFNVRVSPEIHRKAVLKAANKGISLNKYVSEIIEKDARNDFSFAAPRVKEISSCEVSKYAAKSAGVKSAARKSSKTKS